MKLNFFPWRSLNTRITLTTVTILVISIWMLAFYVSRVLREDMQRLLSDQQLSMASFMASEISEELDNRIKGLENVAGRIGPATMADKSALQKFLEDRPMLQNMFSGGLVALSLDGTAIADAPLSAGRIGVNYADSAHVVTALEEGKSTVGRPVIDKKLGTPIFTIVAPIRAQSRVIGALVGATELSKPNFLAKVTEGRYGRTGGYLLIAPQYRLVITGTDKSRTMQPLPPRGVNPQIDRFVQGYEGSAVYVNSLGVEILSSVKAIPAAGWNLAVYLPTEEAFAPIRAMQQRILLVTIFLTLLAGLLTWWMLRRQLSPMLAAASALSTMADTSQPPRALPITRRDEVGKLIGGFNRLLEALAQREEALKESEYRWKFALEGAGDGVWDIDLATRQVQFSKREREMLGYSETELEWPLAQWIQLVHPEDKSGLLQSVQDYIDGRTKAYAIEYRLRCQDGSYKWMSARGMAVSFGADGKPARMIGTHSDISERKQADDRLREFNLTLEQRVIDRTEELLVANRKLTAEIAERRIAQASAASFAGRLQVMTRRHAGAQEFERRRLARELHDRVSSTLTAIGLGLGLIARDLPRDAAARVGERLSDTMTLLEDAMANAREISHGLHPAVLEYGGVIPALEEYGRKFSSTTGIAVEVVEREKELRLPAGMEIALFRIAQEAMTNCAKYAKARTITIALDGDAENLIFVVADDGVGFDPVRLAEAENPSGLGLLSMRERAEAIGATLSLDSVSSSGTRVTVRT